MLDLLVKNATLPDGTTTDIACEGGTITAGNAPGLNDGATALLVMTEDKAKELGLVLVSQPMVS